MHLTVHIQYHDVQVIVTSIYSDCQDGDLDHVPNLNYRPMLAMHLAELYVECMLDHHEHYQLLQAFLFYFFFQLKTLTQQQLEEYMAVLDQHMAQELETLRKRYHHKRLPILQAMDAKKLRNCIQIKIKVGRCT